MLASTGAQAAQTAADTATPTSAPSDTAAATATAAATTATPVLPHTPAPSASVSPTATVQGQNEVWGAPVNLSQSGSASNPAVAAEANGSLDVLWWDKFEGTKYAFFTPAKGWSKPATVSTIIGTRPTSQNPAPGAPDQLRLFVDSSHELFAFWIDGKGNLLYAQARAGTAASWTGGLQLASTPLAWDVMLDSAGSIHLAYIRPGNSELLPSGVYYRVSNNEGLSWSDALAVDQSPYFRTLAPAGAHVNVASNGKGTVFVTWDDPQLQRSFFAQSQTGGKSFGNPVRMEAADALQSDSVQAARVLALANGQFLRMWQAGDNCALYQQQSDVTAQNWSVPLRVLDNMGGCPAQVSALPVSGSQLLLAIKLAKSQAGIILTLWDGQAWTPPEIPRVSFVNPVTNRSTALGCIVPALDGAQVVLVGCDDTLDIWATVSLNEVAQLLPALNTAWSPPSVVASLDGDAQLPAIATEADGRMHLLWSQTSPDAGPAGELEYMRGDGTSWTTPGGVLSSPRGGKAEAPALLADRAGSLHAAWSGGFAGEIYYSHGFIRDAADSSGWSSPVLLPAPAQAGSSPAMALDAAGTMHVLYTIPLNEARGVYYTRSADQGSSWSAPQKIFDAAGAQWPMVSDAHLVIDSQNRLQATWVEAALPPATTLLGIFYSRSEDGGRTWTEPVQISGVDTGYPVMAASGPNELHLLWSANLSQQVQLWHQWSSDGGATWSKSTPLIQLESIAPSTDLVTDGAGGLYLVGIQQTADNSAALFYTQWAGGVWTDHETLPLGYTADNASGVRAVILPGGRLSVFYRLRAPTGNGGGHYVLGYTERPIPVSQATPEPSLTPPPTPSAAPTATAAPTLTAVPTPDLNNTAASSRVSQKDLQRIEEILAGMLVIAVVAYVGLRLSQR